MIPNVNRESLSESVARLNKYVEGQKYKEEVLKVLRGKGGMDFLLVREWG